MLYWQLQLLQGEGGISFCCSPFKVVTGFDHQILGDLSFHVGMQNDEYILKMDKVTQQIRNGLYENYQSSYFNEA